jgi:ferrous iron transport protein B
MGMDGVILAAFLLALPANEIAVPIMLMLYQSQGTLGEMGSWEATWQLLSQHGWTRATVVCVLAFMLFHWPCATTLMTIHKETHSWRMVLLGFLIPTTWGCLICFLLARLFDIVPLV